MKAIKLNIDIKSPLSKVLFWIGFLFTPLPFFIAKLFSGMTNKLGMSFNSSMDDIIYDLIALVVLCLIQIIFNCLNEFVADQDKIRAAYKVREILLKCKCEVEYKYIENKDNFIEHINFVSEIAGFETIGSLTVISKLLHSIIAFVFILFSISKENSSMVLLIVLATIPSGFIEYKKYKEDYLCQILRLEDRAYINYYRNVCTDDKILAEVRKFKLHNYFKDLWKRKSTTYINARKKVSHKYMLLNCLNDFSRNVILGIILCFTFLKLSNDDSKGIGYFLFMFSMVQQLQLLAIEIAISYAKFAGIFPYLREFFNLEKLEKIGENHERIKNSEMVEIEFRDVSFSYNENQQVLKKINLIIRNGEKIAIVGANGSGKSTFVNLLCGMRQPTTGKILVNGKNMCEADKQRFTAVFQDFARYDASLRYNVSLEDDVNPVKDEKIRRLLEVVGFLGQHSKMKLSDQVGIFSEDKKNISGGQWQKIALARAVYNNTASVIILDEPTSALDPISETNMYSNFMSLTTDKTTIIISHRLGIGTFVDRIVVFDKGEIVEDGTHEELLLREGIYANLFMKQSKWYK